MMNRVTCVKCDCTLSERDNLNRHTRRVHSEAVNILPAAAGDLCHYHFLIDSNANRFGSSSTIYSNITLVFTYKRQQLDPNNGLNVTNQVIWSLSQYWTIFLHTLI